MGAAVVVFVFVLTVFSVVMVAVLVGVGVVVVPPIWTTAAWPMRKTMHVLRVQNRHLD